MIKNGTCGVGTEWRLDTESGILTISGNGPMADYEAIGEAPWFSDRECIKAVAVEDGVTAVGDYTMIHCENLEKVDLSATVNVVGTFAFGECYSLTEMILPEGVEIIGAKAFSNCKNLKKVHIPLSLQSIDMKGFEKNVSLEEVVYPGTREQWLNIRISMNANGNKYLLSAYGKGEPSSAWYPFYGMKETQIPVLEMAGDLIRQGGDGRFHVLGIQLTTLDSVAKVGDCVLLIFPDGKTMMIDAGVPHAEGTLMEALRRIGLKSLDYFMTSHPHLDHVGNALALGKYIYEQGGSIGTYYYFGLVFKELEPEFSAFLESHGTIMDNHLTRGDVRQIGDVKLEVLRPSQQMIDEGADLQGDHINILSLAVKFSFGKTSYITSGDLYRENEREIISHYGEEFVKATVLKACHHGVYTSNSDEWVSTVAPKVLMVTSDDIGSSTVERKAAKNGTLCVSTGLDGSVLISMSKDGDVELRTGYGRTEHWTV